MYHSRGLNLKFSDNLVILFWNVKQINHIWSNFVKWPILHCAKVIMIGQHSSPWKDRGHAVYFDTRSWLHSWIPPFQCKLSWAIVVNIMNSCGYLLTGNEKIWPFICYQNLMKLEKKLKTSTRLVKNAILFITRLFCNQKVFFYSWNLFYVLSSSIRACRWNQWYRAKRNESEENY